MTSRENTPSLFLRKVNAPLQLRDIYEPIEVLGEGGFGKVLKCRNKDTKDFVAVKVFECKRHLIKEMSMLSLLMDHNLDQCNIVKFFGAVPMNNYGKVLVFEMLDISIFDYMWKNDFEPMLLSDIRSIIQQMATALDALKSIGVIHSDIKTDNIMLVDHTTQPLKAKLIDFGLALPREKAAGKKLSIVSFRSPEVILGLPTISEATDMWSLGCVMAYMLLGYLLFPGDHQYGVLEYIVNVLDPPANHLLDKGRNTYKYFNKTSSKRWRLKTSKEYYETPDDSHDFNPDTLDDLKMHLKTVYEAHPEEEQEQCMDLLMAMLKFDATKRITPSEVLAHLFIDKNEASTSATAQGSTSLGVSQCKETRKVSVEYSFLSVESSPPMVCPAAAMGGLQVDSDLDRETSEDFYCGTPASLLTDDDTTYIQPYHYSSSSTTPSAVVLMVQPATAENTQAMEDHMASEVEDVYCELPATALKDDDTTYIQPYHYSSSSTTPSAVVLMVQPATAENTQAMEDHMASEVEDVYCELPATALKDDDTTYIQPYHYSSSSTTPSAVVLMVQPTTAENTQAMEDHMASEVEDVYCELPATALKDDDTTNIQPDHYSSSSTTPSAVVLMVQPTTAENTQAMEDQESVESEERSVRTSVTDTDFRTKEEKKTKKKKNCFRRFGSWMKKTFCCCWTCPNED